MKVAFDRRPTAGKNREIRREERKVGGEIGRRILLVT